MCPGFNGQQDDFYGQSLAVLQETIKSSVAAQDSMDFQLPEPSLKDFPVENVLGKTDLIWQGRVIKCPQHEQSPAGGRGMGTVLSSVNHNPVAVDIMPIVN